MDREAREQARQAQRREVGAFVALIRRYQHFAFGSALTLVHDFQTAEDVVQEAFLAAWAALSGLADPAAFPSWLRAIVRRKALRVLRQRQLDWRPLSDAEEVPGESALPDRQAGERDRPDAGPAQGRHRAGEQDPGCPPVAPAYPASCVCLAHGA